MAGATFSNAQSKDGNYNPIVGSVFNGFTHTDNSASKVATITNVALTSNVATVTTSAAHGFQVGQTVAVLAGTATTVNGSVVVVSVPSATTFTYAKTASNVASAADTGTVTPANWVSPIAAGTNEVDLVWPSNATRLLVYPQQGAAITNVALTSNVVTVTAAAHGLKIGQTATVSAVTNTAINGTFVVASVPSANTFTYALTATNIGSVADTGSVVLTAGTVAPGALLYAINGGATLGTSQLPPNTYTVVPGIPGGTSFIARPLSATIDFKFDLL